MVQIEMMCLQDLEVVPFDFPSERILVLVNFKKYTMHRVWGIIATHYYRNVLGITIHENARINPLSFLCWKGYKNC